MSYVEIVFELKIIKGMNIIRSHSTARTNTKLVIQQPEHGQSPAISYQYQEYILFQYCITLHQYLYHIRICISSKEGIQHDTKYVHELYI